MATAPKPWLSEEPPPPPPLLVVMKCSTQACGKHLAEVVATNQGPLFWSVITSGAPERKEIEEDQRRRLRSGSYPGELETVRRNRAMLAAEGFKLPPLLRLPKGLRPGDPKTPNRRYVCDFLEAPGPHPDLETHCRRPRHGFASVERETLMEKVREAVKLSEAGLLDKPLVLGIHH